MEIVSWSVDNAKVNSETARLVNEFLGSFEMAAREGKDRKLFASAITPNGFVNFLPSILNTEKVFVIKGMPGTGTEKVLERLKFAAIERGFDVESFYCALNPMKFEHLVIPGAGVSFTTSNEYHYIDVEGEIELNLDNYINRAEFDKYEEIYKYNKSLFNSLMDQAIKTIAKAKSIHDDMEAYYIPNMNFEAVQQCLESTKQKILK